MMETKIPYEVFCMNILKKNLLYWMTLKPQTMEVLCAMLPEWKQIDIEEAMLELIRSGADIRLDLRCGYYLHYERCETYVGLA